MSAIYQGLPRSGSRCAVVRAVRGCAGVTEFGHLKAASGLAMAGLQPAEGFACADLHGARAGDEGLFQEGLDSVAERGIAARQQAQAFDGRAADDVALVFTELPEDFSGEADLLRSACGAGGDKTEMPACARFVMGVSARMEAISAACGARNSLSFSVMRRATSAARTRCSGSLVESAATSWRAVRWRWGCARSRCAWARATARPQPDGLSRSSFTEERGANIGVW